MNPGTVSRWQTAGRAACEAAGVDDGPDLTDAELAACVGSENVEVSKLYRDLRAAQVQPTIGAVSGLFQAIDAGNWRAARFYVTRTSRRDGGGSSSVPVGTARESARRLGAGGRPTKLTPGVHAEVVRLVGEGNFANYAAASVGIGESTLYRWLKRGRRAQEQAEMTMQAVWDRDGSGPAILSDDELAALVGAEEWPYVSFARDVDRAAATAHIRAVEVWSAAAEHDTTGAELLVPSLRRGARRRNPQDH